MQHEIYRNGFWIAGIDKSGRGWTVHGPYRPAATHTDTLEEAYEFVERVASAWLREAQRDPSIFARQQGE